MYCVGFIVLRKRDSAVLLQSLLIYDSLLLLIHDRKSKGVYQAACKVMTKCDMHKNPCYNVLWCSVFLSEDFCRMKVCPMCIIKIENRY